MDTTINEIMELNPSASCTKNLLKQVGDTKIDIASLVGGENDLSDVTWLLAKMGKQPILVELTTYSAELVLHIYGEGSPSDAPREAIQAAEGYLKNPSEENRSKAQTAFQAAAEAADAAYTSAAHAHAVAPNRTVAPAHCPACAYASPRKEIQDRINSKLIELVS